MSDAREQVPIAVTGIGIRCPVGASAAQSITSVRARLNRFRAWPFLPVDFSPEGGGLPVASPIDGLGDASWPNKAPELAFDPLEEALFDAGLRAPRDLHAAYKRESLAAFLALPEPERPGVDADELRSFLDDAAEHCVVDVKAQEVAFLQHGHAGALLAVERAWDALASKAADVCVVGGIDSLLETHYLISLLGRRKVKVEGEPAGLVPGEAAAFLVLERAQDAERRGAKLYANVGAAANARESVRFDGTDPIEALGVSAALRALLQKVSPDLAPLGDVYADLNGERGRFQEWALAETRCMHVVRTPWKLHHPADCTGDLGAAAGALLLALAAADLRDGRARGKASLVCAASEGGERAGALLLAPNAGRQ